MAIQDETTKPLLPVSSKDVVDSSSGSSRGSRSGLLTVAGVTYLSLWYIFSGCTLFLNKYILTTLNGDPTVLGMFQLLMTTVCGSIQWHVTSLCVKQPPRRGCSPRCLLSIVGVGILRFLTTILSLLSLKLVAVSFTETVKSSAPIFTVFISQYLLGERTSGWVKLSLIPVMLGLALCSSYELSFHLLGFLAALGTNVVECAQNVYSKLLLSREQFAPAELQFYTSAASVLVQLPAAAWLIDAQQVRTLTSDADLLRALVVNGVCFHLQSLTAYLLIGVVSPVTYSVSNTVKRALLIWLSILIFHNRLTALSALGTALVLLGVLAYNKAQELHGRQRARAEVQTA